MNAHLIIPDRTGTRKARVPMTELIRLINECRQSGMTDADWCRENDIAVSAFYHWVSRCRKTSAYQIPEANYGHLEVPRLKQDVVPIDIVPAHIPEQHTASPVQGVQYCSRLFTIEDSVNKKYPGDYEKRNRMRLEKEKPVLEAFWSWLWQQKPVRNN